MHWVMTYRLDVEIGDQRQGTTTDILVLAALNQAGQYRPRGLFELERLDASLFIRAHDTTSSRRGWVYTGSV